jgi:hypothetical protein
MSWRSSEVTVTFGENVRDVLLLLLASFTLMSVDLEGLLDGNQTTGTSVQIIGESSTDASREFSVELEVDH